ncbi:aspartate aminotransferase family protein, partial [Escherichia coli]|nr:aspartate aminotransferase family protein [Escherichia coli]
HIPMSPEEFKRIGYRLIDWIAEYRERVEELPVMAQVEPGFLRSQLPQTPPRQGVGLQGIPQQLEKLVPGLMGWQSPNFFG